MIKFAAEDAGISRSKAAAFFDSYRSQLQAHLLSFGSARIPGIGVLIIRKRPAGYIRDLGGKKRRRRGFKIGSYRIAEFLK